MTQTATIIEIGNLAASTNPLWIGGNNPYTTPGGPYAPYMIERFTRVTGNTLSIYYTISTWNPYTTVEMRSE